MNKYLIRIRQVLVAAPLTFFLMNCSGAQAQSSAAIASAWEKFRGDPQLKYASAGFELVRAGDGKPVFASGEETLLSPASTQKIITAAAALELLGEGFRYSTQVYSSGTIEEGVLKGDLRIRGNGDPTLGSERFQKGSAESFLAAIGQALGKKGIRAVQGNIVVETGGTDNQLVPDGWIWQDIGNYYGAGAGAFNWRENQYDLLLNSEATPGGAVRLVGTKPELYLENIHIQLKSGAPGSGDNAYIYFVPGTAGLAVRGTIPPGQKNFSISGAVPDPAAQFLSELSQALMKAGIEVSGRNLVLAQSNTAPPAGLLLEQKSPSLDSMVYWFLQKSVNLYGEALLKTLSLQKNGKGSTEDGAKLLETFWVGKGISAGALQLQDGSGLSPQNGATASALNKVLLYAAKQPWYAAFYKGLPLYNGLHAKSGTIGGVKCYTGFIKSSGGTSYVFTVMVNRYNGSAASLNRKIFQFLDVCK